MARTKLPFANGFYVAPSLPFSAQRCVNFFPVIPQAQALSEEALYPTPGVRQFGNLPPGRARGATTLGGKLIAVVGVRVYDLRASGVETTAFGDPITGDGPVLLANNGRYVVVLAPGAAGYVYDPSPPASGTGLVTQITDPDFTANGNPTGVTFIDGYFVFTTDQNKIIVSELNDPFNYNALDFSSADAAPDDVVAPFVFRNQLMIAGTDTIEAFQNTGGLNFPFSRSGLFFDQGVLSPYAIVRTADAVFFLGSGVNEKPSIWALSGNGAQPISTDAIDALLGGISKQQLQRTTAWYYAQDGHRFVGFTLSDTTLVYDITTQRWHERRSVITSEEPFETRWRVEFVVSAFGRLIALDTLGDGLGELDSGLGDEFGESIVRYFTTVPFQNNMRPFSVPSLEMTVESGLGDFSTIDPQVSLDVSRDGGKTWNNKRRRGAGQIGQYGRRVVWRRNGRPERFDVYRFSYSDPPKLAVLQLTADLVTREG